MNLSPLISTDSLTQHSSRETSDVDVKSDSTIELQFSESTVRMLATRSSTTAAFDSTCQEHLLRKRCVSRGFQNDEDERTNCSSMMRKKQRSGLEAETLSDHSLKSSGNAQAFIHSAEINQPRLCESPIAICVEPALNELASSETEDDRRLDWLKDCLHRSINALRDSVVQACVSAVSSRMAMMLPSTSPTRDINVNHHRDRLITSEHSLASYHTEESVPQHQIRQKHRIHHRARTNPYHTFRNVVRTPVSDMKVPWSYEWPQYKPVVYTTEEILINPGADPGNGAQSNFAFDAHIG